MEEFWELSPAQVSFAFDALGLTKKRGSAGDLLSLVGAAGGAAVVEGRAAPAAQPRGSGRWR